MIETEIKFKIADAAEIETRILALGGSHEKSFFSRNTLFDTPKMGLKKKGCLLRLREEGESAIITFKGKAMKSKFKKRPEVNLRAENAEKARALLEGLGFEEKWVYEKKTKYLRLESAEITIDEMPVVGHFMEIEAAPREIEKTAKALGLRMREGMKETYADLFRRFKKQGLLRGKNWVF
ncbi:MAG: class IV adenylate cyclase [Candidatus Diapherotrites archaeon]|nr:class IV adenylate cyclase [Candidatus Diapherotrites archaeon]